MSVLSKQNDVQSMLKKVADEVVDAADVRHMHGQQLKDLARAELEDLNERPLDSHGHDEVLAAGHDLAVDHAPSYHAGARTAD